jgi:hypothetical protein
MVGPREHGTEHSGYIKGDTFLDQLSSYQLLKKYYSAKS